MNLKQILFLPIILFSFGFSSNCYTEYNKADIAIQNMISDTPNHKLNKNPELRYEYAKTIVDTAFDKNLDWELIASIIYFESSFKSNVTSKDPQQSTGLMQAHGAAIIYCKKIEKRRINLKNYKDQIICGANWLKYSIKQCNNRTDQGIAKYATGYMCKYNKSKSIKFIVNRRMKLREKIKNMENQKIGYNKL